MTCHELDTANLKGGTRQSFSLVVCQAIQGQVLLTSRQSPKRCVRKQAAADIKVKIPRGMCGSKTQLLGTLHPCLRSSQKLDTQMWEPYFLPMRCLQINHRKEEKKCWMLEIIFLISKKRKTFSESTKSAHLQLGPQSLLKWGQRLVARYDHKISLGQIALLFFHEFCGYSAHLTWEEFVEYLSLYEKFSECFK